MDERITSVALIATVLVLMLAALAYVNGRRERAAFVDWGALNAAGVAVACAGANADPARCGGGQVAGSSSSMVDGLRFRVVSGYFANDVGHFARAGAAVIAHGVAPSVGNVSEGTNGVVTVDGPMHNHSIEWTGVFKATATGDHTFWISSDDASYVWIGPNAQAGYTTANATIDDGNEHGMQERSGTYNMVAGRFYPIRVQYGEDGGNHDCQLSFAQPGGGGRTYDGRGHYFTEPEQPVAAPADAGAGGDVGRYVLVSSDVAPEHILNVAEVQVFDRAGNNVSQGKPVAKSSGWAGDMFPGANLVDGNVDNFAHTSGNAGESPWMRIDLGGPVQVSRIIVFNRVDCCQNRLVGALVQLLDADQQVVFSSQPLTAQMQQTVVVSAGGARLPTAADASPQGPQASVLGRFDMGPWYARNFADQGASWIWNDPNAASSAAANVCVNFNKVVRVSRATPVTVHVIADDWSDLRVNGKLVGDANGGWGGADYPKLAATLVPGRNVIQIQARNGGGPAGVIASIVSNDGSGVLAHTDAAWAAGTICD
jgi:hypothetical protein